MQVTKVISSIDFDKLKKQARNLKRSTAISHTSALEQVANTVGFENWHQVVKANDRFRPTESAFKDGCVVVFDTSDSMDFDTSDGIFVADHLLPSICSDAVYELFLNNPDEEDPSGRAIKDTRSTDELNKWFEEIMGDYEFFRLRADLAQSSEEVVMKLIRQRTFWMPHFMWLRGKFINTYGLAPEDEEGNPVGVRF